MNEHRLVFEGTPDLWVIILFILPVLLGISGWAYRGSLLPPTYRKVFSGIPIVVFAIDFSWRNGAVE